MGDSRLAEQQKYVGGRHSCMKALHRGWVQGWGGEGGRVQGGVWSFREPGAEGGGEDTWE